MPTTELAQILHRRDTAANWLLADPIMGAGEFGVETDTKLVKVGDGTSLWSVLTYQGPQLAAQINLATAKTTPVDADTFPLSDSAASNALKKLTWANIKATLKTYFDTLYPTKDGYTSTATAGGTTTLTVASTKRQVFTGTLAQIVTMPVVSTLPELGYPFKVINDSTGIVTVNSSGGNLIYAIPAGVTVDLICILLTGTTSASWLADYPAAAVGGVTLISQQTVTGTPASTVSFTSIPSTYKNLRLVYLASGTTATNMMCQFNSDSGANYDKQQLRAYNITTLAAEGLAVTAFPLAMIGAGAPNLFGAGEVVIPNYAGTVLHKGFITKGWTKFAASTDQLSIGIYGGAWRSTAAITRIDLTMDGGSSYDIGSSFTLYGES